MQTPVPLSAEVPRTVAPSLNVQEPTGMTAALLVLVTVPVAVTLWKAAPEVGLTASAVDVPAAGAGVTTNAVATVPVEVANTASPA